MRSSTIRRGLRLLTVGILLVILGSFWADDVSAVFAFSSAAAASITFWGIFWGGVCGGMGVVITVSGLLLGAGRDARVRLLPGMLLLAAVLAIFLYLLFDTLTARTNPPVRPGETITI